MGCLLRFCTKRGVHDSVDLFCGQSTASRPPFATVLQSRGAFRCKACSPLDHRWARNSKIPCDFRIGLAGMSKQADLRPNNHAMRSPRRTHPSLQLRRLVGRHRQRVGWFTHADNLYGINYLSRFMRDTICQSRLRGLSLTRQSASHRLRNGRSRQVSLLWKRHRDWRSGSCLRARVRERGHLRELYQEQKRKRAAIASFPKLRDRRRDTSVPLELRARVREIRTASRLNRTIANFTS